MFLSIIIPHYNIPRELLERCINSIIAQGMPDNEYEIIIVDDGSNAKPTWAESLSTNIKLITGEHSGPGGARNKGIQNAQGDYIMFVDADDYLFGNGEMTLCIEKLKNERPHILRYRYAVKEAGKEVAVRKKKDIRFSNTISGAIYMEKNNLSGSSCTFFFQRELAVRKNIWFPENIFHEDEEFNTLLHYHAQTLIDSNATIYCYCIRNGSTTANSSPDFERKRISDFLHIIERIQHFAQENKDKSNTIQAKAIAHKLNMLCVDAIRNMLYLGMSARKIRKECKATLTPLALYPLRKASHSIKYSIFRFLANNIFGMILLRAITPSQKHPKK